ncbi:MAG: sigma-70 family RNA polymerase sigma factor [Candidatus Omnitrophota bacterium]|jgi:RNA polymerase sigma-70 factor (ECF subfamily)
MQDLELLQKCINGDKLACEEFLNLYSRLIYNYIHHVIKSKGFPCSQDLPQDIFQEIYRALFEDNCKKLRTFKAKNNCTLATWLRQVVINFTIDYLRRQKPFISLDSADEDEASLGDLLSDGAERADKVISSKERLAQLVHCIDKLNLDEKFLIELHFKQGLKLERLKTLFETTRGAIDMQKQRLINKLRNCFKSKGFVLDF